LSGFLKLKFLWAFAPGREVHGGRGSTTPRHYLRRLALLTKNPAGQFGKSHELRPLRGLRATAFLWLRRKPRLRLCGSLLSCVLRQNVYPYTMKFALAILVYLLMAAALGAGILLLVAGKPWLFIVAFIAFVVAFGRLGCLTH
jgi:hypothetical protein